MKFIPIYLLCICLFFSSCKKRETFTGEEIMQVALAALDLDCDETIDSEYYLKGRLGGEVFCHHDGVGAYRVYTGIGSTFTTTSPSITIGEYANVSNFSRFFLLSFQSDPNAPLREEEVRLKIKLPNEGDRIEEFLKIMQADHIPYTTWESNNPGLMISVDLLVRLDPDGRGHTGVYFTSSRGDQPNSFCKINDFTFQETQNSIIGEVNLSFQADLYFRKSSKIDGFWKTIEADMVIPYEMPKE